jgi:hypothetical protein
MGRRGLVLVVPAMFLIAACGGSSHKTTTTHSVATSAPATPTTPSSASQAAITRRLLRGSEIPSGFSPAGPPSVTPTIQEFVASIQTPSPQVASVTARYKRLGFVTAASQQLNGPGGGGVSLVEQFHSAAAARSELANDLATFDGGPAGRVNFRLPGVPNSGGFGGQGSGGGVNVAWAAGDYYYLIGEQANAPSNRAGVIAAAQKLYHRLNG